MTKRSASSLRTIKTPLKNYTPRKLPQCGEHQIQPKKFLNAAMAGTGEAVNGGGPIWAISIRTLVKRENWTVARHTWISQRDSSLPQNYRGAGEQYKKQISEKADAGGRSGKNRNQL